MIKSRDKAHPLTIYLIRSGISNNDDILRAIAQLDVHEITHGVEPVGTLYVERTHSRIPDWAYFFQDSLDPSQLGVRTAVSKAVLLVSVGRRLIAVTFGYGRALLNPNVIETNFGLKVTLNSVDPSRIRTIDRRQVDIVTRQAREQTSREISIGEFGLNIDRDMLTAVTGKPTDLTIGKVLSGKDALAVTVQVTLSTLQSKLRTYLKKSQETGYRTHFPWVDNVREVRDSVLANKLTDEIVARLNGRDFTLLWIAIPEIIDWQDVLGFKFSMRPRIPAHPDIDLETFFRDVNVPDPITLHFLKRKRVSCVKASTGVPLYEWSVFQCLYGELELDGARYILNYGTWYELDNGFVKQVDRYCKQIPKPPFDFPPHLNHNEDKYNRRVAADDPGTFALMDRKMISYGGGYSKVEFCDLFANSGVMVHVKKYGGSAVLSHLFAQGVVSAEAFLSDSKFRRAVNGKLPDSHKIGDLKERPDPSKYEVCYAVASNKAGPLVVPFFSKVSLRNSCRQLQAFGYRVSFGKIDKLANQ